MNTYLYRWSLRPRPDIRIEIQIEAESVCVARREVDGFLRNQTAGGWRVEAVSRTDRLHDVHLAPVVVLPEA